MSILTCEVSESTLPVRLFTENPNGLVSLWDMLRIYAANFIRVGARFERCTTDVRIITNPDDQASEAMMERFNDLVETLRLDAVEMHLEHTQEFTEAFAIKGQYGVSELRVGNQRRWQLLRGRARHRLCHAPNAYT